MVSTSSTDVIRTVLVANRGEIALRVFRTCARLGIRTVAIYTDVDADAPHVTAADEARPRAAATSTSTPSSPPRSACGADAVHPGYGFLSERSAFARSARGGRHPAGRADRRRDGRDGSQGPRPRDRDARPACRWSRRTPSTTTRRRSPTRCWSRPRPAVAARGCASSASADEYAEALAAAKREAALGVRRRHDARREVRRVRPAHRGAGARRHPRERRPPLRARLLDPAPAPEGARGGARPHHLPPICATGSPSAAVDLARAGRLHQRRHRGVPARQRAPATSTSWR